MKTFSQYLEEANSKYIVSKNPSDKKWYVMGHVGRNQWMPVSNGFKNRQTNVFFNDNNGTYFYMAFAENPFKNSTAR